MTDNNQMENQPRLDHLINPDEGNEASRKTKQNEN